jgi:RNA polymerase sigma factor (sigma-70 family)
LTDRHAQLARLGDYRSWLLTQAERILGGHGHPDRDDLVQEGYIAMWRALDTYNEDRGSLAGWLTYRARLRMLECMAQRQWTGKPAVRDGRHKVEHRYVDSLDRELTVGSSDQAMAGTLADLMAGVEYLEGTELAYHRGEIMAALAALTPAQRKYVEARFWRGMSESEIKAEVFGYDAGSLWHSQKNGARLKLTEALAHLAGVA